MIRPRRRAIIASSPNRGPRNVRLAARPNLLKVDEKGAVKNEKAAGLIPAAFYVDRA
jgi:hypothetical protein